MDIDKVRALELAVSFVGDDWKLLNEDDVTVDILRYFASKVIRRVKSLNPLLLTVVASVVDCTLSKMFPKRPMTIRKKSS